MIIKYYKLVDFWYNLDIDGFIEFIISEYTVCNKEGVFCFEELNWDDENTLNNFIDYLEDNIYWYLENFGFQDAEELEDSQLDDICDTVITRMEELGKIKNL